MKFTHILATAAFGAFAAACQPPAATEEAPTTTEAPATTEAEAGAEAALPCGVLAQRNWEAELSAGSSPTLTVSGEIDLGTPGYGVSLARNANEAAGATATVLTLALRAPSGMQAQVVTAHPVRYFGPAAGPYTSVQIVCDGAPLTTISIGG
ncbi:MAG: hypothetical protein JNL81_13010 [Hyphomonadaceae bacterium]|nr:hypothetical protein [Hyphomonadaceae bacterium]